MCRWLEIIFISLQKKEKGVEESTPKEIVNMVV